MLGAVGHGTTMGLVLNLMNSNKISIIRGGETARQIMNSNNINIIRGGETARQINLRATSTKPACAGWLGWWI